MSTGLIHAVVVGACFGLIGTLAGCELLVTLDRSAVDAGGSEIVDEGTDTGGEGDGSGGEAAPTNGGGDATTADGAVGHASPEH
jgi:hypothetical protein